MPVASENSIQTDSRSEQNHSIIDACPSPICLRNISGLTKVATSIASAVDEQRGHDRLDFQAIYKLH